MSGPLADWFAGGLTLASRVDGESRWGVVSLRVERQDRDDEQGQPNHWPIRNFGPQIVIVPKWLEVGPCE